MRNAIRYYSKTGNTKKLADVAADATDVPAHTVETPLEEQVDTLFLGSSVYAAGVDNNVKQFIETLDRNNVGRVVCFSTAALLPSTYTQVKKLLEGKGIRVDTREFHCRGRFQFMHKSRPNREDIAAFEQFLGQVLADNAYDEATR